MTIMEAIQARHSVRSYTDRPIEGEVLEALKDEMALCNEEGQLHIQLALNERDAFNGFTAHYGLFRNVRNYIAIVGRDAADLMERAGYYGERLVIRAQQLGLNTCWVAATFKKSKTHCTLNEDEKLVCVIALGYGKTQGRPHRSKPMHQLCTVDGDMPDWFRAGMESALLAPTGVNQQKFHFSLLPDGRVQASAPAKGIAPLDLGIVKYHFEMGAGREHFQWF